MNDKIVDERDPNVYLHVFFRVFIKQLWGWIMEFIYEGPLM